MKKVKSQPPKVEFQSLPMSKNLWNRAGGSWSIPMLVRYCEEKKYPSFDMPLAGIPMDSSPWGEQLNFKEIMEHMIRTNKADLKYPILIDDQGFVCDGWHRIAKAFCEGKTTIKAIRIQQMPPQTGFVETKK